MVKDDNNQFCAAIDLRDFQKRCDEVQSPIIPLSRYNFKGPESKDSQLIQSPQKNEQ